MGTLSAGKRRRPGGERGRLRLHLDHHLLMAQKLDAGTAMLPPTPVPKDERRFPDHKRMQEHAGLARFPGVTAIPLTLLTQGTRTTTANAGTIHHTQAPVGFSTLFMRDQFLMSGTAYRAIRLE